jgi:hypothetical protein
MLRRSHLPDNRDQPTGRSDEGQRYGAQMREYGQGRENL